MRVRKSIPDFSDAIEVARVAGPIIRMASAILIFCEKVAMGPLDPNNSSSTLSFLIQSRALSALKTDFHHNGCSKCSRTGVLFSPGIPEYGMHFPVRSGLS